MAFEGYLAEACRAIERVAREEAKGIRAAGTVVADALAGGGVLHAFGCGHSHMLAEEVFFRAGGLAPVNPILNRRLVFLEGALESTRAERESGFAARMLAGEDVRAGDAAIVASNSGRNVVPIEMTLQLQSLGVRVIAVTSLAHSQSVAARHASGRKLYEVADIVIDTGTPPGDAAITLPGTTVRMGPLSTVVGAAIVQAVMIEAASQLVERGHEPPVLPSANLDTTSEKDLERALARYAERIRYLEIPRDTQ